MKILTVCGMGFGTSLMLKMFIQDVLKELGIRADVDATDLGSVKGSPADFIVAPSDMKTHLDGFSVPVVFIDNLIDKKEIRSKVEPILRRLQNSSGGA
ncbi:MAG: PTS sugar transporter subunit IIB [Symbiobacteriia bacterium]